DADTVIDNCKDWICTAGDSVFYSRLSAKIGVNEAGRDVMTQNMLRCLPVGRPLVLLERANPFITTMEMVRVSGNSSVPALREKLVLELLALETLVFDPGFYKRNQLRCISKKGDELDWSEVLLNETALPFEEPSDYGIVLMNAVKSTEIDDYRVDRNDPNLHFAVFAYLIKHGLYQGQQVNTSPLIGFRCLLPDSPSMGVFMNLVKEVTSGPDYKAGVKIMLEYNLVPDGVSKADMKRVIRLLWTDCRGLF
ncbi:MAG: hypothetical protein IJ856_01630, partial [Candidatus Methanomethylophilaceae archaeon]|nr:hypothetical protein [Candidatus Methanomethylophilaceae archaeon]